MFKHSYGLPDEDERLDEFGLPIRPIFVNTPYGLGRMRWTPSATAWVKGEGLDAPLSHFGPGAVKVDEEPPAARTQPSRRPGASEEWRRGTTSNGAPPHSIGSLTYDKDGGFTTSAKRPPEPDYGGFAARYANWARGYKDVPKFVRAEEWKQVPINPAQMERAWKNGAYDTITLHHTSSPSTPRAVENLHRGREGPFNYVGREVMSLGRAAPYRGYGDVGYHFLIDKDGTIYEGRSLAYRGAHVYGKGDRNIGVAFIGDYSSDPLNASQVSSAKALIHALNDIYDVAGTAGRNPYVFTHKELAPRTGDHARPDELVGAQRQVDHIKWWSTNTHPGRRKAKTPGEAVR